MPPMLTVWDKLKQQPEREKSLLLLGSFKCIMERGAINNTLCEEAQTGVDSSRLFFFFFGRVNNGRSREQIMSKAKIMQTMSSWYLINDGWVDNIHRAQMEPLLYHTAEKQRHKSKLGMKLFDRLVMDPFRPICFTANGEMARSWFRRWNCYRSHCKQQLSNIFTPQSL